jgi:hypothetical protein
VNRSATKQEATAKIELSIVDICQTPADGTQRDAFANAVDLARRAEALGYKGYWLAERPAGTGAARRLRGDHRLHSFHLLEGEQVNGQSHL